MTHTEGSLSRQMGLSGPSSLCTFQALSRATAETSHSEVTGNARRDPKFGQLLQMQKTK